MNRVVEEIKGSSSKIDVYMKRAIEDRQKAMRLREEAIEKRENAAKDKMENVND